MREGAPWIAACAAIGIVVFGSIEIAYPPPPELELTFWQLLCLGVVGGGSAGAAVGILTSREDA